MDSDALLLHLQKPDNMFKGEYITLGETVLFVDEIEGKTVAKDLIETNAKTFKTPLNYKKFIQTLLIIGLIVLAIKR